MPAGQVPDHPHLRLLAIDEDAQPDDQLQPDLATVVSVDDEVLPGVDVPLVRHGSGLGPDHSSILGLRNVTRPAPQDPVTGVQALWDRLWVLLPDGRGAGLLHDPALLDVEAGTALHF